MAKGVTRVGDMFGNGTAAVQEDGLDDENRMPNYGITAEDPQQIGRAHV